MRLIRFEISDGRGIFQSNNVSGGFLNDEELCLYYRCRDNLPCPDLNRNLAMSFYFTRYGFHNYKPALKLYKKMIIGPHRLICKRKSINDFPKEQIIFTDMNQVAVVI